MYYVELLEQYGARPPLTRKTLEWSDDAACTARTLITEHVRVLYDEYAARLNPDGSTPVDLAIYQLPHEIVRDLSFQQLLDNAKTAFENGQVIILANGRQIEALDETIELKPETQIVFLKIIPLKGG